MKRRAGYIDLDTGEELPHLNVIAMPPHRRNGFREGWIAMSQNGLMMASKMRKELGSDGYAVLMLMLAKMDYENFLFISKTDLAKELGMHRPNVYRAFRKVVDAGFLIEGQKVGNIHSYALNPEIGWKGSARNHVIALDGFRRNESRASIPA